MTVLAIAPHPDDEIIGAGGSLAKHSRAGRRVVTVQVVGRERSRLDDNASDDELLQEITHANQTIGVSECIRLDAPSRGLHLNRELRLALVSVIRRTRPDIVYLPHADELDHEHRLVHELAVDGLWMACSDFFTEAGGTPSPAPELVLGYEVWTPLRRFQYVEDISGTAAVKAAAMRAYKSQLRHAAWDEAITGLAVYRGAITQGHGHAEVFEVIQLTGRALATQQPGHPADLA